jgi:hypothetical protein
MNSKKDIQDELNGLNSNLPGNGEGTPYDVPQGYFEGFAASVMAKIRNGEGSSISAAEEIAELSPLLAGISRTMPYDLPANYFAENIASLPAFTSETEESLVLSFVEKEMPYEVPRGYFASFPETVLERLNRDRKVVPMVRRRWMHVAAAAVVAGIITLSGLAYFKGGGTTTTSDPVALEIKKASTEELNAFVKAADVSLTDESSTAQNSTDVKQLLKDVSDKELESFLDQVPTDDEEEFDIN